MELPSAHAGAALVIAVITFWQFASSRFRVEIVSLLLIAALALLFYLWPIDNEGAAAGIEIAFGGFAHEALIAICCLMILGRGLVVTGALEPAARLLTRLWAYNPLMGLLITLGAAALMSMIVNDTPVLVLLLPLLLNITARIGTPASKILMPVNCAILIGGMATTIGTSTNLLVVSIADDLGLDPIGVFDFTGIALLGGLVALPYLLFIMPRLLPANSEKEEKTARLFQAAIHLTPLTLPKISTASALKAALSARRLRIIGLVTPRGDTISDEKSVSPGDIARVQGTYEHLQDATQFLKASLARATVLQALRSTSWQPDEDLLLAEIAIGSDSTLIDMTIRSAQIADRYGVAVVGFYRPDAEIFQDASMLRDERLRVGDVLLVQGTKAGLRRLQIEEGVMLLDGAAEMPRTAKAPIAVAIFLASVSVAALHLLPIAISSLAGAIALLATGCVRFERLGRALSSQVILLVAASIALGRALLETGAAQWVGDGLALGLETVPSAVVLAAMMAFAALLTNFSSNTAAAAVGTPIAYSLAKNLGIPPEPLILAVLFGCNLCFATPIAYQTNILIMSAGNYQFRDYVRAGAPLVLLMIIALSILLVWRYGL